MFINLWCCSFDNALVRTSATMCSVGQYSNRTSPFSTRFRTKWCTSMCFVRAWWVGFLVNDIAPWLSHRITIIFFSSVYPISIINFVIHMASFVACMFAMYSASMVDNAIVCYSKKWLPLRSWKQTLWWTSYLQDHHPNPHLNIQELPWMVLHRIVISFATYLANIERFFWRPSNAPC